MKKLNIRFIDINSGERFQKLLNTEELHYLSGILGHLEDLEQLKYIERFIKARIKEVRRQRSIGKIKP